MSPEGISRQIDPGKVIRYQRERIAELDNRVMMLSLAYEEAMEENRALLDKLGEVTHTSVAPTDRED